MAKKKAKHRNHKLPDASAPIAGYEYQFVWAANRCLNLLLPKSNCSQVVIESLHGPDIEKLRLQDEDLLVIDVSEYEVGNTFAAADKVVISQLKHSSTNPNTAWTARSLCTSKSGKSNRSVIGGLGLLFRRLCATHSEKEIVKKVILRVVTNRPIQATTRITLEKANVAIANWKGPALPQLRMILDSSGLTAGQKGHLRLLYKTSGLKSQQFTAFLQCIDLTGFSQPGLTALEVLARKSLLRMGYGVIEDGARKLVDIIRDAAKTKGAPPIRRDDVFACLGCDLDQFIPAPNRIADPDVVIETGDLSSMIEKIIEGEQRRFVVHGAAGKGKSIAVSSLCRYLPRGSISVIYDCYANGEIEKTPDKHRHSSAVFCGQITNELAITAGTGVFFFKNKLSRQDYWSRIQDAVATAAGTLDGKALLLLAIDAADNAWDSFNSCSSYYKEDLFLEQLWRMDIPPNVRMIVTCRTHRRKHLMAPDDVVQLPLKGFSRDETDHYLAKSLGVHDPAVVNHFHKATKHTPRLQQYWISSLSGLPPAKQAEEILARTAFGIKSEYESWLLSAAQVLPATVTANDAISVLRSFRQPFSLPVFAAAMGFDEALAEDFCRGLEPGMVLTQDLEIEFRDEDFESILDESLNDTERRSAHRRIAECCERTIDSYDYSARNLAFHLFQAQESDKLAAVSKDLQFTDQIERPDDRDACASESVHLALRTPDVGRNQGSSLQLMFRLAELSRSQDAGSWMFKEYPETCVQNGLHESVRKALLDSGNIEHEGSMHFQISYSLTLTGNTEAAMLHLQEGEAWLRDVIAQQHEHGMPEHTYNIHDSACYALALALLKGMRQAFATISRWNNELTRARAIREFVILHESVKPGAIVELLSKDNISPIAKGALMSGLFSVHRLPAGKHVKECAAALKSKFRRMRVADRPSDPWVLDFAELALRRNIDSADVVRLLPRDSRRLSMFTMSRDYWVSEWHDFMRLAALRKEIGGKELSLEDVIQQDEDRSTYNHDREQTKSRISRLLPAYTLRAKALNKRWNASTFWKRIESHIGHWRGQQQRHEPQYQPYFRSFSTHVVDTLLILNGSATDLVDVLIKKGEEVLYPTDLAGLCLDLAEMLVHRDEYTGVAQELVDRAVDISEHHPQGARAKCGAMIRASRILVHLGQSSSQDVFGRALNLARDVDEDAPYYARSLGHLAQSAGRHSSITKSSTAESLWSTAHALSKCSDGEESFPWADILAGMSSLDCDRGHAALCDLDAQGLLNLQEGVAHFLAGVDQAETTEKYANTRTALIPMSDVSSEQLDTLLHGLRRASCGKLRNAAFSYLARSVLMSAQYGIKPTMIRRLIHFGDKASMNSSVLECLIKAYDFYADSDNWQRVNYQRNSTGTLSAYRKLKRLIGRIEKGAFDGDSAPAIRKLLSAGVDRSAIKECLVKIGMRRRGDARRKYLSELSGVKLGGMYSLESSFANAISALIAVWSEASPARKWVTDDYVDYVVHIYPSLVEYDSSYDLAAQRLLEHDTIPEDTRREAVLAILREYGNRLPPRRLYELIGSYAKICNPTYAMEVLQGQIDEMGAIPSPLAECSGPPEDPLAMAICIITNTFGHMDNRVRWQALHAARLAMQWSNADAVRLLVGHMKMQTPRLWMSARSWILFTLLHVCHSDPKLLVPHINAIRFLATDESFPHAGHQELARAILQLIADNLPAVLDQEMTDSLVLLNRPTSCLLGRDTESVGHRSGGRFNFDSMDTMPYWYSHLGGAFGLHRCDVAVRAEKWVCDNWGLNEAKCREQDDRQRSKYDWTLSSHRQGGRPTVETYTRYIEWHAMMMAGGDMVRSLPVEVGQYSDGDEDQFEDWIQGNAFPADVTILSDICGPVPLDSTIHGARFDDDSASRVLSDDDYHNAFQPSNDQCCIAGHYTAKASSVSWTWDVDTALVNENMSRSLGLAMLSSEDPYSVRLPFFSLSRISSLGMSCIEQLENGGYKCDDDLIVNNGEFLLTPWVVACHSEEEMGGKDPAWPSGGRSWYALDNATCEKLGLTRDRLSCHYHNKSGSQVAVCEVWNDEDLDAGYRDRDYAAGNRLLMNKGSIIKFLKKVQMDLIVRVAIIRHADRSYRNDETTYKEETGIFVLSRSGKLSTIGLRAKPRQGSNS